MSTLIPTAKPTEVEELRRRVAALEVQVAELARAAQPRSGIALLLHAGDLDRVLAGMTIATAAAAMGEPAKLFFAFWATAALRRADARASGTIVTRLLGRLLPSGASDLALSRLHLGGLGTWMLTTRMRALGMESLEQQFQMARELGVKIYVCETSMQLLGLGMDDLVDYPGLEACGAATFLSHAIECRASMAL